MSIIGRRETVKEVVDDLPLVLVSSLGGLGREVLEYDHCPGSRNYGYLTVYTFATGHIGPFSTHLCLLTDHGSSPQERSGSLIDDVGS